MNVVYLLLMLYIYVPVLLTTYYRLIPTICNWATYTVNHAGSKYKVKIWELKKKNQFSDFDFIFRFQTLHNVLCSTVAKYGNQPLSTSNTDRSLISSSTRRFDANYLTKMIYILLKDKGNLMGLIIMYFTICRVIRSNA